MGCCGSKKKSNQYSELECVEVDGPNNWREVKLPVGADYQDEKDGIDRSTRNNWSQVQVEVYHDKVDGIGHSARYDAERHFFRLFFSVMVHIPRYQGILRRWKREAKQAEQNGGRCEMVTIWPDKSGYVKTLHQVKVFVSNKRFSWADCLTLTEWMKKVVEHREKEYKAAMWKGKADLKHLKVLEEWRGVRNTLQNLA